MAEEKTFFTEVGMRTDRERVFGALAESTIPIQIQPKGISGDAAAQTLVIKGTGLRDASLVVEAGKGTSSIPTGAVVVSFQVGTEKYFMQSRLFSDGAKHFLDLGQRLFRLQRRDNYRLPFPPEFGARLLIRGLETLSLNLNLELVNLSGGGCAVDIHPQMGVELRKGQVLRGDLRVKDRLAMPVVGIVRHSRAFGSRGSGIQRVGIEFQNLTPVDKENLIKLVMELHRELFSKFKFA